MVTFDEKHDIIPIYKMRMAGELMIRGFVLKNIEPDPNGSRRKVFIFNNSPQIVDVINELLSKTN